MVEDKKLISAFFLFGLVLGALLSYFIMLPFEVRFSFEMDNNTLEAIKTVNMSELKAENCADVLPPGASREEIDAWRKRHGIKDPGYYQIDSNTIEIKNTGEIIKTDRE